MATTGKFVMGFKEVPRVVSFAWYVLITSLVNNPPATQRERKNIHSTISKISRILDPILVFNLTLAIFISVL